MMLRTRSNVKLDNGKDESKLEENKVRMPGGARLWRLLSAIILLAIFVYIILYDAFYPDDTLYSNSPLDPNNRQLTVVMNTFKRPDLMREAVKHYSRCGVVKYIHIIWSEETPPSDSMKAQYPETVIPKVQFDIQVRDSLNNRFKPLPAPYTDAIFSVDDDIIVPCSELQVAYDVWRGSSRSIVGFMPRLHVRKGNQMTYRCWWRVWWDGAYSIILTKAALLHHDYFKAYFDVMPSSIRELVDSRRNCEDIAMQYLIANMTSLPPIYVKGHLEDKGALNGISTSKNVVKAGHMKQRDSCLNDLDHIYGRNPLVSSKFIVDLAKNRWNHSPSTWFEYLSSDLWKW